MKRFLSDEGGDVTDLEIDCLKLNTGSSCILEQTPEHLPDRYVFSIQDVIAGPLNVEPVKNRCFKVPDYFKVKSLFSILKDIDREHILKSS